MLPPLTNIIRTTPAMSLLYECINGIIQGGILGDADDISGREEIASLCVTKLRGMMAGSSDPNCETRFFRLGRAPAHLFAVKYVALLAFNRIVVTHPFLVAEQEDVILECIDSEDITIRVKALDLVQGMVSSENLLSIVSRLMRQLKTASSNSGTQKNGTSTAEAGTDSDEEPGTRDGTRAASDAPPLPEQYTRDVIGRILDMCSRNNYASLVDFEWYVDVLTQLIRLAPAPREREVDLDSSAQVSRSGPADMSERIGNEIRNVAVKVKAVRHAAVRAAQCIIAQTSIEAAAHAVVSGAMRPISWVAGEYASQLNRPDDTLNCLLQLIPRLRHPEALASALQAVVKIFALMAGDDVAVWTSERKSRLSLLMARMIHTLEPLTLNPYLEVQERAVQFAELVKLTAEAASGQAATTDEMQQTAPLLLTQAIPSLFHGWELNSVAPGAQKNVPVPEGLDLDEPIHPNLASLLAQADVMMLPTKEDDEFEAYYHQKPSATAMTNEPALARIADAPEEVSTSYQQAGEDSYLDADMVVRRKMERMERNKDDPFYIHDSGRSEGRSTPIHSILQKENGPDLDIDAIPIMQLDLHGVNAGSGDASRRPAAKAEARQKIVVATDETLAGSGLAPPRHDKSEKNAEGLKKARIKKLKQSLLQVDSSHLNTLSIDDNSGSGSGFDYERQQREEAEMAQAVKEVERLRLEMQRANERIQVAQGVPAEGTAVKKKVPKARAEGAAGGRAKAKKKKMKKQQPTAATDEAGEGSGEAATNTVQVVKNQRPKRVVQLEDGGEAALE